MTLVDARGVEIEPGDVCLYGFGVGQSVAMAEGVVLGNRCVPTCTGCPGDDSSVSLTPSGRVRLRVIRRSYSLSLTRKPVVDVAPDRLVVLKTGLYQGDMPPTLLPSLPPSPLPTQDEANRQGIENLIEAYTADLRATEVPDRHYYEEWTLTAFHAHAANQLTRLRRKLKELDAST